MLDVNYFIFEISLLPCLRVIIDRYDSNCYSNLMLDFCKKILMSDHQSNIEDVEQVLDGIAKKCDWMINQRLWGFLF